MKRKIAAIILATVVVASAAADGIDKKFAALFKAFPDSKFTMMVIPVSGSFISNKIIVASLKAGTDSKPSQEIASILQAAVPTQLAVSGDNDAVAAATLQRALSSLKGKSLPPHELAFIGDKEYEPALSSAAAEVGIKLTYIPFPNFE